MTSLKLAINPCPAELSHQSLHNILDPWVWKKLRMMRNPEFCEICNWQQSDKPRGYDLRMHEVFDYQIKRRGDQRVWRIDWTTFDPKDVEEFVVSRARDFL
jgi:hypothetical protein